MKLSVEIIRAIASGQHGDPFAVLGRELEAAGYHAQVVATENSFPLFLHDAYLRSFLAFVSADGSRPNSWPI